MAQFFQRRTDAALIVAAAVLSLAGLCRAQAKPATTRDTQVARAVGTIKNTQRDSITVVPDSGGEITATLAPSTKILRVPPGEKDLKNAVPLPAQDLKPGDRVLVRGQASADGHSIAALAVIVMKQGDLSAKQQHEREDWQKRGVGGLVSAVDPANGTITISSGGLGATHDIAVHTTKSTVCRRYAPNSVKFDDAKLSPLDQIKPGDQLRARGTRNPDGSELTAEEIVSGSFRNIAGAISAIDTASNTMTVKDTIGKAPVVVKVSADSQLKKLPQEFAQRIALRLKANAGGNGDQGGGPPSSTASMGGAPAGPGSQMSRGAGAPQNGNGPPDLQRFLGRLPNSSLADLQKGDVVMIVSTQGEDAGTVTAITLLSGVEPILTAAPSRAASTLLSPWSLGAPSGEGEAAQ
ncbi:MAG: DUF5666 domain-containing protein [Acidobacteriia bacterium]|nr:DUF5666 domain-containing protein [Terriglobia bacterium]